MMTKKKKCQYKIAYVGYCFCTGNVKISGSMSPEASHSQYKRLRPLLYVKNKTHNIKILICVVDKQLPESDWSSPPSAGARVAGARGDGDATRRGGHTAHERVTVRRDWERSQGRYTGKSPLILWVSINNITIECNVCVYIVRCSKFFKLRNVMFNLMRYLPCEIY